MSISQLFSGGPILLFPPTTTAEPGEVLTVAPGNVLAWSAVTPQGSVTGTANEISVNSSGGNVSIALNPTIVAVPGSLSYNASNDESIQFPDSRGNPGQVLASNGSGRVDWVNQTGGTVSISGTPNEIVATTVGNSTTLAFDSVTAIPGNLLINTTTAPMAFPTTNGSAGQILSTNGSGQLSWINETSSGTISGTPNEIITSTSGNVTTLAFDTQTHIPGQLTINSFSAPMAFPTTNGSAGQILSTNGSGQLSWVNETAGGAIQGTANEIVATTIGNTTTLAFDSQTHIPGQLTLNTGLNAYSLPTTAGTSGQVLTWPVSGTAAVWENTASPITLTGAASQIAVTESTPNNYVIGLTSTVDTTRLLTGSLNVNSAYEMPTTIGLENQVLSVGSGNNLVWSSGSGSSGVNSITSTDPNILIAGTASNPTIGLANQITLPAPGSVYAENSLLMVPSTGASYAKIGSDALIEDDQSAQVIVSNEDRDCYGSLALNYNASSSLQNATLKLTNNNTVAGVNNSTTIISATGGINMTHNTSTLSTNITAEQLDMSDSATQNITSVVAGMIVMSSGNDTTAISGTGVIFHSQSANAFTMPPNRGTADQVIQIDNPSIGSTKWATIGGSGGSVTITGTANQIAVAEPTNNDFVLSLPSTVDVNQLTVNSAYTLPTTIGAAGDILTVPTSGTNLQWLPNVNVQGTTNEISVVERTTNNFAVGLPTTVDINTLNVGNVSVNSSYSLPTSKGSIGEVLTVGSGTVLGWTNPAAGSVYTNTDGNLVINNTTHTINAASTINLASSPTQYLNSITSSQIQLSDTTTTYGTIVYPGSISLTEGATGDSVLYGTRGIHVGPSFLPFATDSTSLSTLQWGFGTPSTFQFGFINLYGTLYTKNMVFGLQNNNTILCQGTSGTLSSASFAMPLAFQSLLPIGTCQQIASFPLQEWHGVDYFYSAMGCMKLYNNDGTNYQLVLAFASDYDNGFDNFQNGYYYTFWNKHDFPNDNPVTLGTYI